MPQTILLTRCMVAIVDDADFPYLAQFNWHAKKSYSRWYARRNSDNAYMHHVIMGREDGKQVDHENRNSLDNRRENLRFVTKIEQARNRSNALKTPGVSQVKSGKWKVVFQIGLYESEQEAIAAATTARTLLGIP